MKKILFVAAVALAGTIFLPSCKKDYTCVCTYDDMNGGTESVEVAMNNVKKKDAKDACSAMSINYSLFTGVECKLK
jgi:hypothetical protein